MSEGCEECVYLDANQICNFYLVTGVRRGCPGGDGCTRKTTERKNAVGRKANWDTDAGDRMHLEGKTIYEIAKATGAKLTSVQSYARKHWRADDNEAVAALSKNLAEIVEETQEPRDDVPVIEEDEPEPESAEKGSDEEGQQTDEESENEADLCNLYRCVSKMCGNLHGMQAVLMALAISHIFKGCTGHLTADCVEKTISALQLLLDDLKTKKA